MKRGTDSLAKFLFLQKELKLPKYAAVGLLQTLWDFTILNTPEGNIGKFTNEEIALALGYDEDPDALIEALVKRHWLDPDPVHRLVIHHWPDHCEDRVHERLAKERRFFADGSIPKLVSFRKEDRPAIERDYQRMIAERAGVLPAPAAAPVEPAPQAAETPAMAPPAEPLEPSRPETPVRGRSRPETPGNALTEPSRALPIPNHAEPSRAEPRPEPTPDARAAPTRTTPTPDPGRAEPRPDPSRAAALPPPGPARAPVSVGRSDSAISSISELSDSVVSAAKPSKDRKAAQELFARLLAVSRDGPDYRTWWHDVGALMRDNGGMPVLVAAIEYAEKCADPVVRKAKSLGPLNRPGAYISGKCKEHLAPLGIHLPAPPSKARTA